MHVIQSHRRFFEDISHVTHGSTQLFQWKPKIRLKLSKKDLCKSLLSNGVNPLDIHRRSTRFLKTQYQQKCHWLGPKVTKRGQMTKGCGSPKILLAGDRLIKPLSSKQILPFMKKKPDSSARTQSPGRELRDQRVENKAKQTIPSP